MKIAALIVRVLLGLAFIVFGANGFLHFMNAPMPGGHAGEFAGAMAATGYFSVVAALQILGGLLLLAGYVPLGLLVLGPIVVNIVLFHLCMAPEGLPVAGVFAALTLFLLWSCRDAFRGMLQRA